MISISHAPNATHRQRKEALGWLFLPWKWFAYRGETRVRKLEEHFSQAHGGGAVAFSSGREALYAVLKALGIGEGHEVIVQAFTCMVVPHAVIWAGAQPVYADIDKTLNIDPDALTNLLTDKTKAIIVQHTFGMPANMAKIGEFCKAHNLLLIEDVAHALGGTYDGKPLGSFGDAAIFSFGRDKVIASTAGGMASSQHKEVVVRLQHMQREAKSLSRRTIVQNLLHPVLVPFCAMLIPVFGLGSALLRLFQQIGLLNKVYTSAELASERPKTPLHRLPEPMAGLALSQYELELQAFEEKRRQHALVYAAWIRDNKPMTETQQDQERSESSWLRYTILIPNRADLLAAAKKQSILLGDWYSSPVMPTPKDLNRIGYVTGSCPKAEQAAKTSVNLPTYPKLRPEQREKILTLLSKHLV